MGAEHILVTFMEGELGYMEWESQHNHRPRSLVARSQNLNITSSWFHKIFFDQVKPSDKPSCSSSTQACNCSASEVTEEYYQQQYHKRCANLNALLILAELETRRLSEQEVRGEHSPEVSGYKGGRKPVDASTRSNAHKRKECDAMHHPKGATSMVQQLPTSSRLDPAEGAELLKMIQEVTETVPRTSVLPTSSNGNLHASSLLIDRSLPTCWPSDSAGNTLRYTVNQETSEVTSSYPPTTDSSPVEKGLPAGGRVRPDGPHNTPMSGEPVQQDEQTKRPLSAGHNLRKMCKLPRWREDFV